MLVVLAAFAVFALALVGPAQELCLSEGNHFAIEPRHAECPVGGSVASAVPVAPAPASSSVPGGSFVDSAATPTGAPCADVSLGVELQNVSQSRAKLPVPQPAQICASFLQILDAIVAAPRAIPAPVTTPWRPPALSHLRTVVIRC